MYLYAQATLQHDLSLENIGQNIFTYLHTAHIILMDFFNAFFSKSFTVFKANKNTFFKETKPKQCHLRITSCHQTSMSK